MGSACAMKLRDVNPITTIFATRVAGGKRAVVAESVLTTISFDPQPHASGADNCLEGNHSRFQPKRASALLRPSRALSDIGGRRFFFPALGSIEFGNGVGAQFKDPALDAVALVLAGA